MNPTKSREKADSLFDSFLTLREMLDARRGELISVEKALQEEIAEFNKIKKEFTQVEAAASAVLAGLEMRILDKAYASVNKSQPFKDQGSSVAELLEQFKSLEATLTKPLFTL
jgi:hypothetical protein